MLSRVAEAVFWTGRYIERAENIARFIDVNLQMSLDAPISFSEQWEPLVAITGDVASFNQGYGEPSREHVIQFLTSDRDNPSSIVSCLQQARENARSIREVISSELWEQINRFYLLVSNRGAEWRALSNSYEFFGEVKMRSHLVAGVADNTMSHNEAWHFFRLGQYIERSDNMSRLLDVKYFLLLPSVEYVGSAVDEMQWLVLLRCASAFEMYRKRFGRITPGQMVDFLMLDRDFPRSILFCLIKAEESLQAISQSRPGEFHNAAEQRLGRLRSELGYAHADDIVTEGLHQFLEGYQIRLAAVSEAVTDTYFRPQYSLAGERAFSQTQEQA